MENGDSGASSHKVACHIVPKWADLLKAGSQKSFCGPTCPQRNLEPSLKTQNLIILGFRLKESRKPVARTLLAGGPDDKGGQVLGFVVKGI